MAKVAVSRSVLRWAINRSGKAAEVERKFPKFREWERGDSQPTVRQLEKFAKETATPFGYLFLSNPPEERLPIPHFRTLNGHQPAQRPSPDLLETVRTMERRRDWMREYIVDQGQEPLPFVHSSRIGEEPQHVARKMTEALGLPDLWASSEPTWTEALKELRNRMEDAGIIVTVSGIVGNNTRRKLDPTEFRGFVLVDEHVPLVFVNGADGKAAQMFTLAHELAHVWFGSSAAFDLRNMLPAPDETEQACNRVAAEFLVPERQLRQYWRSVAQSNEPFQAIARHFKVSVLVAARRALDLRLITRNSFLEFYRAYLEDERRRAATPSEGGNFYASQNLRLGRRFAEAVVRATKEGKLLYREAYQLTGLYGKAFERYAEALGFGAAA
jgi:Zn-dependent peptidase ImmA (M78 family)